MVKILILSRPASLKTVSVKNRSVVILGNGPSLKHFLNNHTAFLAGKDTVAVNYFARTNEYELIKPSIYYITSPEYFRGEEKQEYNSSREETLKDIAEKTNWPMYLVVPVLAKSQQKWKSKIELNPNIKIAYVNNTPLDGFKWFRNLAYGLNFGMPRPHNVLIGCIWLSINLAYKDVYLVGADHSWLPDLMVDEKNQVLIRQSHFYDDQVVNQANDVNKPIAKPMYVGGTKKQRKLHEVLEKFYYSFQSYWILKEFAEAKNTKIYNATGESYIDAFDKINLNDL